MPTIKTGNTEWDQNLNTLGAALFPDPSKEASAYYYGTKSRESLLESAKTQNQLAAGNTQLGMTFGRQPAPTYRPGPFDTSIMNDPYAVPAAPGPTAPPALPGQPVAPVQALPTLGTTVATTPPPALANAVVAGVEHNATSGPGPEATASNGTRPQNGPGTFQPGSVTSAGGGGVIMSGPAAADGTPAPAAFNFGQAIALGVAAGQTPQQAYAVALGTLGNMVKNGQMALPLAEQMAAFYGAPSMRNQALANEGGLAQANVQAAASIKGHMITAEAAKANQALANEGGLAQANVQAAASIKGHVITAEAAKANQAMVTGENRRQFDEAPVQVVLPGQTAATTVPRSKAIAMGLPHYDSGVAVAAQQGANTLANTVASAQNEMGDYVHPDFPTAVLRRSAAQAQAAGLTRAPTSTDQQSAIAVGAAQNAPTLPAAETVVERARVAQQAIPPKGKTTAEKAQEDADQQYLLDQALQQRLPPTPLSGYLWGQASDQSSALKGAASGDLGVVLGRLTNQYLERGPAGIKGQIIAASNAAIQQGIEEGWINPNQTKDKILVKDVRVGQNTVPTRHFQIDIVDPKTKQPLPEGSLPNIQMKGAPTAAAPAAPAPSATARPALPPGAVAVAPAGLPEGHTGSLSDGRRAVNRGGFAYPVE